MLTKNEEDFILYWQEKRKQNKLNPFLFGKGFGIGAFIGIAITISFSIGWNKQAPVNILNSFVILIAFLSIALFCALFYNSFKFEQNEQLYHEFLAKKKKNNTHL